MEMQLYCLKPACSLLWVRAAVCVTVGSCRMGIQCQQRQWAETKGTCAPRLCSVPQEVHASCSSVLPEARSQEQHWNPWTDPPLECSSAARVQATSREGDSSLPLLCAHVFSTPSSASLRFTQLHGYWIRELMRPSPEHNTAFIISMTEPSLIYLKSHSDLYALPWETRSWWNPMSNSIQSGQRWLINIPKDHMMTVWIITELILSHYWNNYQGNLQISHVSTLCQSASQIFAQVFLRSFLGLFSSL